MMKYWVIVLIVLSSILFVFGYTKGFAYGNSVEWNLQESCKGI